MATWPGGWGRCMWVTAAEEWQRRAGARRRSDRQALEREEGRGEGACGFVALPAQGRRSVGEGGGSVRLEVLQRDGERGKGARVCGCV